jgi:hypothetical protein
MLCQHQDSPIVLLRLRHGGYSEVSLPMYVDLRFVDLLLRNHLRIRRTRIRQLPYVYMAVLCR